MPHSITIGPPFGFCQPEQVNFERKCYTATQYTAMYRGGRIHVRIYWHFADAAGVRILPG
jgi:hypothetical protein